MFKIFKLITEALGWLQIAASPFLLAIPIGVWVYYSKPDKTGLTIAISITAIGLIIGIVLATRIWKKQGTIQFLSRISATPELDDKSQETKRDK